jgi:hypothetical protein
LFALVSGELLVVSGNTGGKNVLGGEPGAPFSEPGVLATGDPRLPLPAPVVENAGVNIPGALLPPLARSAVGIAVLDAPALPVASRLNEPVPPSVGVEWRFASSNAPAEREAPEWGMGANAASRPKGSAKKSEAKEKIEDGGSRMEEGDKLDQFSANGVGLPSLLTPCAAPTAVPSLTLRALKSISNAGVCQDDSESEKDWAVVRAVIEKTPRLDAKGFEHDRKRPCRNPRQAFRGALPDTGPQHPRRKLPP